MKNDLRSQKCLFERSRFAAMFAFVCLSTVLMDSASRAGAPAESTSAPGVRWTAARPDGHAPAGVMADHLHHAGEWMFGYRFMFSRQEDLVRNGSGLGDSAAAALEYSAVPTRMDMFMHMGEVMYAPTDWLTLMVMPQFVEMTMEMRSVGHDMGHHGSEDHHGGEDHHHEHSSSHSHGTNGFGDTPVVALIRLAEFDRQSLHLGLGVSIPTGSVDEKEGGHFVHYGMQLGSGTWDLLPSLTWNGQSDRFSWGAQLSGVVRLEEENDSGFSFGDVFAATSWGAWKISEAASVSIRLAYRAEGDIEGHYNGPHHHSSPPDFQANYGGETLTAGLGLNIRIPTGVLKGHRLAVEIGTPLWQDLNGVQLERQIEVTAAWQYSF